MTHKTSNLILSFQFIELPMAIPYDFPDKFRVPLANPIKNFTLLNPKKHTSRHYQSSSTEIESLRWAKT
jgi:hypothetical protein